MAPYGSPWPNIFLKLSQLKNVREKGKEEKSLKLKMTRTFAILFYAIYEFWVERKKNRNRSEKNRGKIGAKSNRLN